MKQRLSQISRERRLEIISEKLWIWKQEVKFKSPEFIGLLKLIKPFGDARID